jgi:ABC-type lipoprotein release transport system permease subunit
MTFSHELPLTVLARLAWRNLWRNQRRTLIMLLAIVISVWAMLFMIALMRGMVDQMLRDGIKALPGHVQIHDALYPDDPSIDNSLEPPTAAFLAAMNDSEVAGWAARVRVPAMISSERDSRGVTLLGVDPGAEISIGFDPADIIAGRFLLSPSDAGVVIGKKLMERLETRLGDRLVIMSQDPDNNVADRGFRIVGVYSAQLPSLEERFVYAGREVVQKLLGVGNKVSEIAVLGRDFRHTDRLEELVRANAPPGSIVQSWKSLDAYLATMLRVMDGFVLVWIVVIFMAMSFGLVNTLMMAVFERVREIGLMLALGMRPILIVCQVMIESSLLLGLGLTAGTAAAVATVLPLADGIDISIVSKGMEWMGAASVLFPSLKLNDVILANGVLIVLGLLTSLLPAWRASRYRPVEAITKI